MPVELECTDCGHRHQMSERPLDSETNRTHCPKCDKTDFVVIREGIQWHPAD